MKEGAGKKGSVVIELQVMAANWALQRFCVSACVCGARVHVRSCVCVWLQGCGVDEAVRKLTGAPAPPTQSAALQRPSCPRGPVLMEAAES